MYISTDIRCYTYGIILQRLRHEQIPEGVDAYLCHLELVVPVAVVLEGEDHGVVGRHEGGVADSLNHVL